MKIWKLICIASLLVGCSSGALAAGKNETACKKWVSSYLDGLKFAEEQIKNNPSLAVPHPPKLSRTDIQKLRKTKSDCDVKVIINKSLNK